ncbi:hypothetical protein ICW40_18015 [Actinotalea ferrariae]|uniref:carboxypeptidase regulatory-like domain-containing protein n=1 Tax=Actinotalea ferrariae TaxID=1386098 RepID=UPI001C8BEBB5|nr:carboxypeptidase regulatory-like domain-containing protein [Actinotalea ferrariae]MBX9246688.1 hypothetical protein [Actinotalea ferrariae]
MAAAVATAGLVVGGWTASAAQAATLAPVTVRVLGADGAPPSTPCSITLDGDVSVTERLSGSTNAYAITRADGTATLHVPPGTYTGQASCYDGVSQTVPLGATVTEAGADLGDVRLLAPVTIAGTVVRSDGSRVPNASVQLRALDGTFSGGFATIDGAFTGQNVPGEYDLVVRPMSGSQLRPSTTRIMVGAGGLSGVVVTLPASAPITGTVTAGGVPVRGVSVSVMPFDLDTVVVRNHPSAADGSFLLDGLAPGTYTLSFSGVEGYLGQQVVVTAPATGVAVALPSAGRLSGRVATADGGPLPEWAEVTVDDSEGGGNRTAVEGAAFDLTWLQAGAPHAVGVNRQSGRSAYAGRYYAGDGQLGAATRAAAAPVVPTPGGVTIGTTVLDRCASVSGRVLDVDSYLAALPFSGVSLQAVVFNDDDPDLVTRTAEVAPDGSFTVPGLLPGRYYAAINVNAYDWEDGRSLSFSADDFYLGADPADGALPPLDVPSCAPVAGVNFNVEPVPAGPTDVVSVTPVRLVDDGAVAGFGQARCASVAGAGAPVGASGVMVNVASVSPRAAGNVVLFPDDGTPSPTPPAAGVSVNFEPGRDVANAAFVKIGANGRICWYSQSSAPSRVVVDVVGFTMPDSGVTLAPSTRLLDTRPGADHVGDIASALKARTVYEVTAAGRAGVPADAKAVVLNIAVVNPAGLGHLRVYPADGASTAPDIASVNYAPGTTKSNASVVPIGAGGKIGLYSDTLSSVPTNVVLDVTGYVAADGQTYQTVTPERVLDTRASAPAGLRPFGTLAANTVYALDVRGTDVVPDDATGVVLNVTAIKPSTMGNLRVYPDSDGTGLTAPPNASAINYIVGRDIPNLVVVGIPADGKVAFYSNQGAGGTVDVAVDVVGYVTSGTAVE